jgi:hypothetical protein
VFKIPIMGIEGLLKPCMEKFVCLRKSSVIEAQRMAGNDQSLSN